MRIQWLINRSMSFDRCFLSLQIHTIVCACYHLRSSLGSGERKNREQLKSLNKISIRFEFQLNAHSRPDFACVCFHCFFHSLHLGSLISVFYTALYFTCQIRWIRWKAASVIWKITQYNKSKDLQHWQQQLKRTENIAEQRLI